MKIYEMTIQPVTGFGTPLKGDTIFGHFCWQIAYDDKLTGKSIDVLLSNYQTKPFIVFSSAYPKFCVETKYHYAFKTPNLPLDAISVLPEDKRQKIEKRKDYKAKRWMILREDKKFSSLKELELLNDDKLLAKARVVISNQVKNRMRNASVKNFISVFSQPHNTINRLTGTTGEGRFAPFTIDQQVFFPETELALFIGIDENAITIEQVKKAIERIGDTGFGKDASTGLGRFQLGEGTEIDLAEIGSNKPNACYTLAPCVPERDAFSEMFFTPFTRYGKHGDVLAKSANPFKKPIIMADEGAVFIPKSQDVFKKPFVGKAITAISKVEPRTVAQGYSLYIPVEVEV